MKNYIYTIAACLLLSITASTVAASGQSVSVQVPSSFAISGYGKLIDDSTNEYAPGPGPITFIREGDALYVRVPAVAPRNGTRLVSLEDRERGIGFRNNTMLLPLGDGEKAGSLVIATDSLTAEDDGYYGQVTGLELRLTGGPATAGGVGYTAGAVILLRDLPPEAGYRVSFAGNGTVEEAIASDLEVRGQGIETMSPTFAIEGASPESEDAVGYVIVTIQAGDGAPGPRDANNTTLYWYNDRRLSAVRPQIIRTDNGTLYQTIAPGPGQFALIVSRGLDHPLSGASATDTGGLAVIGGVLAVLLIALAAMVRRVTKR